MQKSKKLTAVYALIMDLPLSIVITVIAQALGGNLSVQNFIPSCILAYVLTFFINFSPADKWGFNFAVKRSQPGTFKFGILINLVIAFVFVVILDIIMTAFGMVMGGAFTWPEYIKAVVLGFIPCYVPTLVIAMLWNGVADKASRAICKEYPPQGMETRDM